MATWKKLASMADFVNAKKMICLAVQESSQGNDFPATDCHSHAGCFQLMNTLEHMGSRYGADGRK